MTPRRINLNRIARLITERHYVALDGTIIYAGADALVARLIHRCLPGSALG